MSYLWEIGHFYFPLTEFLRTLDDFRAYLIYPALNLPATTNTIESAGKIIKESDQHRKNSAICSLRATAFLRLKKFITCNGKKFSTDLTE